GALVRGRLLGPRVGGVALGVRPSRIIAAGQGLVHAGGVLVSLFAFQIVGHVAPPSGTSGGWCKSGADNARLLPAPHEAPAASRFHFGSGSPCRESRFLQQEAPREFSRLLLPACDASRGRLRS